MPLGTTTRHRALTDEPGIKYVAVGRSFDCVILATYTLASIVQFPSATREKRPARCRRATYFRFLRG